MIDNKNFWQIEPKPNRTYKVKTKLSNDCKKMLNLYKRLCVNGEYQESISDELEKLHFDFTMTDYENYIIEKFCIRMNYLEQKYEILFNGKRFEFLPQFAKHY